MPGGVFTGWVDHGGILTSEPRPVAEQGGQVLVFVRGLDLGPVAHRCYGGNARDLGQS